MKRALGLVFWLGVVGLLLALLGPLRSSFFALLDRSPVVAVVNGSKIHQRELAEALREHLWRTGEQWSSLDAATQQKRRETVLQQLLDERMIRIPRQLAEPLAPPRAAAEELQWFQRQLGFADGRYNEGLQSQGLTEKELSDRMHAQLEDQAWVEKIVTSQVATISEADARAWFDAHRADLKVAQTTRAAHLFLSIHDPSQPDRRPKIQKLATDLKDATATFDDLVAKNSEDERTKLRGGDLGWFTELRMPQDFMAAVDKLEPGQISEPVETELGWHIIKLIDRKPARQVTFEEAKEEILAHLRNQKGEETVKELLSDYRFKWGVEPDEKVLAQTVPAE